MLRITTYRVTSPIELLFIHIMYMKIPYYNLFGKHLSGKMIVRETSCPGNVVRLLKLPQCSVAVCSQSCEDSTMAEAWLSALLFADRDLFYHLTVLSCVLKVL